jgi:formylglycine-generating enzyme required for sulfatase activity
MDGRENLKAGNEMNRVLRGGAFYFNQENVRCAARYWYNPNVRYNFIGFRVVVAPGFPEKLWALESPDSAAR